MYSSQLKYYYKQSTNLFMERQEGSIKILLFI